MLPWGPKGHRVKSKKSYVDPLDQYWLNFAVSSSPTPPPTPKPMLSATACLRLIVSHYEQMWHLLLRRRRARHGDKCWALGVATTHPDQSIHFQSKDEIYSSFCLLTLKRSFKASFPFSSGVLCQSVNTQYLKAGIACLHRSYKVLLLNAGRGGNKKRR